MDREMQLFAASRISHYRSAYDSRAGELPTGDFYRDFSKVGLDFGPTFRNIKKPHLRKGKSVFEISIGDPGEIFSTGQPGRHHLIHPTTLDSIFAPTFCAMHDEIKPPTKPMVPTFIEELAIFSGIPDAVGTNLKGVSVAQARSPGEVTADIDVFD